MPFMYDRSATIEYAKTWYARQDPYFADPSIVLNNNVSFIYRALNAGGLFGDAGSYYTDFTQARKIPVIFKGSNLVKSLTKELRATHFTNTSLNYSKMKTGDVVRVTNSQFTTFLIAETSEEGFVYYSNSPSYYAVALPEGSVYTVFNIPDLV